MRYIISASMLLFCLNLHAQDKDNKNMFKVNLSSFVLKGFGLQYERALTTHISVALGYSKIPTSSLPFNSFLADQIDDADINIADFKLGTSIFTPEVRFYVSRKGTFRGFYFAPYGRFGKYKVNGPIKYYDVNNTAQTALFNGSVSTATGGLMLGSNFKLSKHLYLDWWILGASIGGSNGNFTAAAQLDNYEQESLRNVLNDADIPFTTITSNVNAQGATVNTTGKMAGIRGLGINLGWRF